MFQRFRPLGAIGCLVALSTAFPALLHSGVSVGVNSNALRIHQVEAGVEIWPLESDKPVERDISSGESHRYRVSLDAGQFLRLSLDRQGINVFLALFAPDSAKLLEVNKASYPLGQIQMYFVTEVAGSHQLEVRLPAADRGPGRYKLKIEEMRNATDRDRKKALAELTFVEAQRLLEKGTADSLRASIEKRREALDVFRALGDDRGQARSHTVIGLAYFELGDNARSLEHYREALALFEAAGDDGGQGVVLANIGAAYNSLGEAKKAIGYLDRAVPLQRDAGDREGAAMTLNNIGAAHYGLSEYRKAAEHFEKAAQIHQEIGYRRGQALALHNLGYAYYNVGEWQKSLDYFNRALQVTRAIQNRRFEGGLFLAIGVVYSTLNEPQKAIEFYNLALPVVRETGDRRAEANILGRLGRINRLAGDHEKAFDYFNKALSITRDTGNRLGESNYLRDIGQLHEAKGDKQKALEHFNQALAVVRAVGNRLGEAATLNDIGGVHASLAEYGKSLEYQNQALELYRAIGSPDGQAQVLYDIARSHRGEGNLTVALSNSEAALQIIEVQRTRVASPESRASYLASMQGCYSLNIDTLMQLHRQRPSENLDAAALEASERARARSLLELISEARIDIRQGVETSLVERERELTELLNSKSERQSRLLSGKHTAEQAESAARELQGLVTKLQLLQTQIRAASPRYAALTQPQPLTLKTIQNDLLDGDTILLQYALGDERSYVWAISRESMTSHDLPKRVEIEAAARRFYDMARQSASNTEQVEEGAATLSDMLLSPVAARLKSNRIVVVADGILHYIPFAALPAPRIARAQSPGTIREPLVARNEIINLPSASVLAVMRREVEGRRQAPKTIAVFADPVFNRADPRLRSTTRIDEAPAIDQSLARDLERAVEHVGMEQGIARLPFSRREAQAILEAAPAEQSMKALDFEASRASATSDELSRYRIVHFATHGLLNSQHPELSGIVLSLVDQKGQPQNGFLRLHEIYNMKLPADLVVLSACQTGLGKEIRGEGLVGLTRGFMYAGAARVVASLWKVDDAATAELMKRFYGGILVERLTPAAALRKAQIEMSKQKRWRSPYYWAAFVLQGEWR